MVAGLAEAFSYEFMQRALLAGAFVAVTCAVLGVFMLLRGQALLSDGLAHISFAGIALALLVGWAPLEMALVAAALGAVGIQLLRERGLAKSDVAIGLFFTGGLALGIALVSHGRGITGGISTYLFGSILAVSEEDVLVVLALAAGVILVILALYKELLYLAFDEEAARVAGLPVRSMGYLFSILTAASVVLAARVVGVLLVGALIIVPAATGLRLAKSFRAALALSIAFGLASVALGLWASLALDVAAGAAIALAALVLYTLATAAYAATRRAA
ncbi:MAG TPA: metal ABC transporter permease [Candidatus Thermoplasmatota archaeon]|nr:metal ABC transporter permease [Candidatus Thermoplasmatota archaeon]